MLNVNSLRVMKSSEGSLEYRDIKIGMCAVNKLREDSALVNYA